MEDGRYMYYGLSDEEEKTTKTPAPHSSIKIGNRKAHSLDRLTRGVGLVASLKLPVQLVSAVMGRVGEYTRRGRKEMICEGIAKDGFICGMSIPFSRFYNKTAGILDHIFTHFDAFITCTKCPSWRNPIRPSQLKRHYTDKHPTEKVPEFSYDLSLRMGALMETLDKCIVSRGLPRLPRLPPSSVRHLPYQVLEHVSRARLQADTTILVNDSMTFVKAEREDTFILDASVIPGSQANGS